MSIFLRTGPSTDPGASDEPSAELVALREKYEQLERDAKQNKTIAVVRFMLSFRS